MRLPRCASFLRMPCPMGSCQAIAGVWKSISPTALLRPMENGDRTSGNEDKILPDGCRLYLHNSLRLWFKISYGGNSESHHTHGRLGNAHAATYLEQAQASGRCGRSYRARLLDGHVQDGAPDHSDGVYLRPGPQSGGIADSSFHGRTLS